MSNYNDNQPVVQNTYVPPVVEAVEPERSFLSRFWWLLPLLALLIALPFILRACRTTEEHVAAPATVVGQCAPGTVLTLDTFSDAMPEPLRAHAEAFAAAHDVTVNFVTYPTSTEARDAYLAGIAVGGAGVGDVVMIEGDHWATVAGQHPASFVTLPEVPGRWLDWAENEGRVGGALLGYRTDIGPVSIIYNASLLEEHGFGQYADPEAFSAWIGGNNATWDSWLEAGREWTNATGIAWVDSLSNGPLRAALRQIQPAAFEDPATGNPIPLADNSQVHDLFMKFAEATHNPNLGAGVPFWNEAWGSAMTQGEFVSMVAPPWQIGWPLRAAGGPDGDWRIATVFPGGGANWGGSFAAVPATGNNIECAVLLADWVTNNDAGEALWSIGSVPSQAALLEAGLHNEPGIQGFLGGQDYAPVLTNLADNMPPANYRGQRFGFIQDDIIFNNLGTVEDGINSPEAGWQQAVSEFNAQGFPTN